MTQKGVDIVSRASVSVETQLRWCGALTRKQICMFNKSVLQRKSSMPELFSAADCANALGSQFDPRVCFTI